MHDNLLPFYLILVPLLGIAAQWIAWRLKIPSILLLLGLGILLGIWLSPDQILAEVVDGDRSVGPKLLFPLVSLSVGVILFEGGLTLRLSQLSSGVGVVVRLLTISSFVTWGLTAALSHFLLGFDWRLAWLLGAILMVTGPTVVGPLLRQIRPNRRVSSILHWEGILIDPFGAVAAVLVFEVVTQIENAAWFDAALMVGKSLFIGVAFGTAAAALLVLSLKRYWIPDFLHGVFFLVVGLASFWCSNWFQEESGLVTVTILGIGLANQKHVSVEHVLEFKEHLRVLLISCLFILLGSRLQLSALREIGWVAIPFILLLVFCVRPLSVYMGTLGCNWPWRERLFVGLVAPRGIVAASVASVFALKLSTLAAESENPSAIQSAADQNMLYEQAALLAPVTFVVILGTVLVCGLGAGPLARWLGLADANPQGILFAGASRWVREVALALQRQGIRVTLVDTNFGNISSARQAGLHGQCANILSEQVEEETDLSGIGKFLAVTPNDEVNTLAAMEYMHIFSRANVYQLPSRNRSHQRWHTIPENRRGRLLFHQDCDHHFLEQLFETGAAVKTTTLSEAFSMAHYRETHGQEAVIMFVIDNEQRLRVRTTQDRFEPVAGDKLISIVPTSNLSATTADNESQQAQATDGMSTLEPPGE